jgi:hypothetical protein
VGDRSPLAPGEGSQWKTPRRSRRQSATRPYRPDLSRERHALRRRPAGSQSRTTSMPNGPRPSGGWRKPLTIARRHMGRSRSRPLQDRGPYFASLSLGRSEVPVLGGVHARDCGTACPRKSPAQRVAHLMPLPLGLPSSPAPVPCRRCGSRRIASGVSIDDSDVGVDKYRQGGIHDDR